MFEVTQLGHNMAMFNELDPKVEDVLNQIEIENYFPEDTTFQKKIIADLITIGFIRRV